MIENYEFMTYLVCSFHYLCQGKRSYGVVHTEDNWIYLDRFCFASEAGNFYYSVQYPVSFGVENLYLYYDTKSQWASVYNTNLTCEQKESILDPTNNQQIELVNNYDLLNSHISSCYIVQRNNDNWYQCDGNRRFISKRARWWFIALGNCNATKGIYLEFDFLMTNGARNSIWFHHFSADEFYILPVDILFCVASIIMLVLAIIVACALKNRHLFHQTFKLFLQALLFECCSLFFMCASYGRYAQNGIGLPFIKLLGQICRAASTLTFLVLLLLLAKGYTITRGRLSNTGAWKLTILVTLFVVTYTAMFVWQMRGFDPAVVIYISESIPGYIIAVLRIIAWMWYCVSAYITTTKYPYKRHFYHVLVVLMTFWFWMGPVSVISANFLLDNWVREEVVNFVDCSVAAYGFVVFMVLTWPSSANVNFPYHVRTSQVGDSSSPADEANYPQNAYEVRYSSGGGTALERRNTDTVSSRAI